MSGTAETAPTGGIMNNKLIIILLLIILLTTSVDSYKVFPNPPPPSPSPQVESTSVSSQKQETVYVTNSTSHFYSSSENGDLIKVDKSISPNHIDYCLIKRSACLSTEIKGTKWAYNNIYIKDNVEYPVKIVNISQQPSIYDPFKEVLLPTDNINYGLDNNTLNIYVKNFKENYRIKYAYNIISNKTGSYKSNVLIRTGNSSTVTDLEYSKDILIRYPEFDVNVDLDKLEVYNDCFFLHDPLHITYNILYTSASLSPILCNISFDYDYDYENFNEFDIFLEKGEIYNGQSIIKELSAENYTAVDLYVRYKNAGPHRIPGIFIEGRPFVFDYEIGVTTRLIGPADKYYQLLSIVALVIALYLTHKEIRIMREQINHILLANKNSLNFNSARKPSKIRLIYFKIKRSLVKVIKMFR